MITSVTEILDTCDSPEQGGGETELSRLPSSNNIFPLAQELSSSARAAIKNELTNVQKFFFPPCQFHESWKEVPVLHVNCCWEEIQEGLDLIPETFFGILVVLEVMT